jgi:hypothetical protein
VRYNVFILLFVREWAWPSSSSSHQVDLGLPPQHGLSGPWSSRNQGILLIVPISAPHLAFLRDSSFPTLPFGLPEATDLGSWADRQTLGIESRDSRGGYLTIPPGVP